MSTIDAAAVMELRKRTGAGMMECKKFLAAVINAANGDMNLAMDLAITEMRKAGQGKADKKSDRVAAEGVIVISVSPSKNEAVMLEVNSETDFVARDSNFMEFTDKVVEAAIKADVSDVKALSDLSLSNSSGTVEMARQELVAKIGENIQIRRLTRVKCDGVIAYYLHSNRIGVIVALNKGSEDLAKNIAMHIAASKPVVISADEVSPELIANEREIFMAQASESGKPKEIIEKMVQGRINKFLDEVSLLGQPYVKDPNKKISQLLAENNAEIASFTRFEVGEGIEKKEDNFVEEVMSQVRE